MTTPSKRKGDWAEREIAAQLPAPLPRDIKESEFGRTFEEAAHLYGWVGAHFRPGMTQKGRWVTAVSMDGKGWLDYFLVHPDTGDKLAAELKVRYNKPTAEQEQWRRWLEACDVEAHVWWPTDWPVIVARLAVGAR